MPWEHRLPRKELADEAAKTPNIRSSGVLLGAKQYLWRSIPPGCDIVSKYSFLFCLWLGSEGANESKITDLGVAFLLDEYI